MAKYDALRDHLRKHSGPVSLPFAAISDMVPGGLPASAYTHTAWWQNDADGRHVQARAWLEEGRRVKVDRARHVAHFEAPES